MKNILEGLQILIKYFPDGDIAAEHDIIYAGGDGEISEEDREKLEQLRWHFDDSLGSWFHYT